MQHANTQKAEIIIKVLGEVIKERREKLNKSQRLFADEFGIQKSLLSRIENGTNEPKLISVCTIAYALGLKPHELIKEVDARLPDDFSLIDL